MRNTNDFRNSNTTTVKIPSSAEFKMNGKVL